MSLLHHSDWVYVSFYSDPRKHDARVRRVQADVSLGCATRLEKTKAGGKPKFMCTARAPWQNLSTRFADYKEKSDTIFVGEHILFNTHVFFLLFLLLADVLISMWIH
jgi:hypothetical protein